MGYLFLLLAARCYASAGTSHDLVSVSASVCHKLGVLSNESSRFLCMYVWILHCVLRTFEYLKIRVLISGTLPKTPDWRKFRHHVERCALLGLDRLELRRLRADLIYSLLQDYTRSGFVVARQFFSRLFAIQEHVVIHLNCFTGFKG